MTNVTTEENGNDNSLALAVGEADILLGKTYLSVLGNAKPAQEQKDENVYDENVYEDVYQNHVRMLSLSRLVLDKSENVRDKLATVFQAIHVAGSSFLMLVTGKKDSVTIKVGVRHDGNTDGTLLALRTLGSAVKANFPGVSLSDFKKLEWKPIYEQVKKDFEGKSCVATVTDIPGLRFKDESMDRRFMQGIEKLVDAMLGEEYSFLVIADPVSSGDLSASRRALENLYSNLVPFSESQITAGESTTESISQSLTQGVTKTVTESVSSAVSHTVGTSHTETEGESSNQTINGSPLCALVGAGIGSAVAPGMGTALGASLGGALGGAVSFGKGRNHSLSVGKNESTAETQTKTQGESGSVSESVGAGMSRALGTSASLQVKFENHTVKQLLDRIDRTLKRYDECGDLGMWNCAAYFLAKTSTVAQTAASIYHALVRGEDSSLECGGVTTWGKSMSAHVVHSLRQMRHPHVKVNERLAVTPGTLVSSAELAIGAGFPNRSVPGVPVLECAEFGRTVSTCGMASEKSIELGNVFNMNSEEELPVNLDVNRLASHVFVTGSTGSGKSNTVHVILENLLGLQKQQVKFLVVEPAKGEYRRVFGEKANVSVYGTNPSIAPLLRINPFSFPHGDGNPEKNIHILEHLDRLVEIFNVCWPMYAAMPAVLKEAIERSYEDCGWILTDSTNPHEKEGWKNLYPTFADVTRNIRKIIDSSEYDAENKGAYKGSLITRLKSLTNGINGLVFTEDEIPASELFDENVIVDLSRVGSMETKALLMGVLVLKLQEHRMATGDMNAKLRHVTVLEEAHNLLKRTSSVQTQESGNLLGKSVEMLANSIAEMRTYGEGFIVVDQAPGLMDMAAIRNTNTKIVMRLPDQDDRELVGKAMHLNDDQISELAKLPCGVAAVYQNEWVESVLCKVQDHAKVKTGMASKDSDGGGKAKTPRENTEKRDLKPEECLKIAQLSFKGEKLSKDLVNDLRGDKVKLTSRSRLLVKEWMDGQRDIPQFTKAGIVVAEMFPESAAALRKAIDSTTNKEEWTKKLNESVERITCQDDSLRRDINQAIMTDILFNEMGRQRDFEAWYNGGFLK